MTLTFLIAVDLGLVFMNIPPALATLMPLYQVSYTQISLLISAMLWSHALMLVPAGIITDRLGVGRTLLMCFSCMFVGNTIPALLADFTLAIGGRVITGIGTGMCFVATLKLIALSAPGDRIGSYQAFFAGIYSMGNVIAYLLIPQLVILGWQWPFILPGGISLLLLVLLPLFRIGSRSVAEIPPLPLKKVLSIPQGWVLGVYHALSWGAILSLGNWTPSLIGEVWTGSTTVTFAWGGALVMLISGLGRLCGGIVLLRFSPLLIANGSILILGIVFLFLFAVPTPAIVLFLAILAAWFSSINFGAIFHLASRSTSPDSLGTFLGFLNLLANLGAVLFTLTFGWVKDHLGSFSWGFLLLGILSLSAFSFGRTILSKRARFTDGV